MPDKEDGVSHTAGIVCPAKPGEAVRKGQNILELRADDPARFGPAREALEGALTISAAPSPRAPLVIEQVGA